jgi:PAS domain S-box-containing protein
MLMAKIFFESAMRELDSTYISPGDAASNKDTMTAISAMAIMRQTLFTLTSAEQSIAFEANHILDDSERYLAFSKQLSAIITRINSKHEELNALNALLQQNLDEVAEQMVILTNNTQRQTREQLSKASLFIYGSFAIILLASVVSGVILYFINRKLISSSQNIRQINDSLESANVKLKDEIAGRLQIEESLHQYERIVSASQEHMAFIDKEYIYRAVNDAYLAAHQKKRSEIIGHSVVELFEQQIFEHTIKDNLNRALRGEHVRYEAWFDFAGTGKRCMDVAYYPYVDDGNTIAGLVVNSRDITERKLAEAELQHAHKMESIGTMAGGIAHDFNNILTGILGYTELTMQEVPKGSRIYDNLEKIEAGGRRAADLVRQILAFSRQDEQSMKPLILQSLIKETIKFLRGTLPATIEVKQDIDPMCRPVLANATQFYQIIMNLGSNAHHAMRQDGGILSISLKERIIDKSSPLLKKFPLPAGNYAHITVSDTGCGIDPLLVDRIFEPYFTTKDVGEGTGLGLATVHGIVKSYGGHLFVASSLGKGTSFDIFIPLYREHTSLENIEDSTIENLTGQILFVDDEMMIVESARQNLSRLGLEVEAFSDSIKALDAFQADPDSFDLVVTDQMMPKMTGTQLAKEILHLRPDLPIILYTGFTGDVDEEQAKEMGIQGFLVKPLEMKTLALKIQLLLSQTAATTPQE